MPPSRIDFGNGRIVELPLRLTGLTFARSHDDARVQTRRCSRRGRRALVPGGGRTSSQRRTRASPRGARPRTADNSRCWPTASRRRRRSTRPRTVKRVVARPQSSLPLRRHRRRCTSAARQRPALAGVLPSPDLAAARATARRLDGRIGRAGRGAALGAGHSADARTHRSSRRVAGTARLCHPPEEAARTATLARPDGSSDRRHLILSYDSRGDDRTRTRVRSADG